MNKCQYCERMLVTKGILWRGELYCDTQCAIKDALEHASRYTESPEDLVYAIEAEHVQVEIRGPKDSVISWSAVYDVLHYKGYDRMLPSVTVKLDAKKDGLRAGEAIHAVNRVTGQITIVTYNDIISVLDKEFDL